MTSTFLRKICENTFLQLLMLNRIQFYYIASHDADARLHPSLQRARRRLQMLNDCDDGVLLVRRRAVMTQMRPYTRSIKRARYEYATPHPKYGSPHQP